MLLTYIRLTNHAKSKNAFSKTALNRVANDKTKYQLETN